MKTLICTSRQWCCCFFCILCRVLVCCPQTLSSRHKNLLSHSHKKFFCLCDRSTFFSLLTSNYLNTTIFCITRTTTLKTLTQTAAAWPMLGYSYKTKSSFDTFSEALSISFPFRMLPFATLQTFFPHSIAKIPPHTKLFSSLYIPAFAFRFVHRSMRP